VQGTFDQGFPDGSTARLSRIDFPAASDRAITQ